MLVQVASDPKDDVSLFSIDTGMHGHPFMGNFFDLNADHLTGNLKPMRWNPEKRESAKFNTLTLRPSQALGGDAKEQEEL